LDFSAEFARSRSWQRVACDKRATTKGKELHVQGKVWMQRVRVVRCDPDGRLHLELDGFEFGAAHFECGRLPRVDLGAGSALSRGAVCQVCWTSCADCVSASDAVRAGLELATSHASTRSRVTGWHVPTVAGARVWCRYRLGRAAVRVRVAAHWHHAPWPQRDGGHGTVGTGSCQTSAIVPTAQFHPFGGTGAAIPTATRWGGVQRCLVGCFWPFRRIRGAGFLASVLRVSSAGTGGCVGLVVSAVFVHRHAGLRDLGPNRHVWYRPSGQVRALGLCASPLCLHSALHFVGPHRADLGAFDISALGILVPSQLLGLITLGPFRDGGFRRIGAV
jgi:hypothetical protein